MYERTGEGEAAKPGGRAIVPFIAKRHPHIEWHEWHGKRESETIFPEPCGEKKRVIRPMKMPLDWIIGSFILARSGTGI